MSQLHNFLHVPQNIYQWHKFCQIRISLSQTECGKTFLSAGLNVIIHNNLRLVKLKKEKNIQQN